MEQFQIINTTRSRFNRLERAQQPVRGRFKQIVGQEQLRVIRCRPLVVSADWVIENLSVLLDRQKEGCLEVRTMDGRLVDLNTLEPAPLMPTPPLPNPPLDSAANDKNGGNFIPQFAGGETLREVQQRAEALKKAAELAATALSDAQQDEGLLPNIPAPEEASDEDEVEFVEAVPSVTMGKKRRGK